MLTDEPAVLKVLLRMVVTLEENVHAREDLLQEALVHLWSSERQHPGQRRSWYLQGVNFYLHHLKASGRSLDSPKRRGAQAAFSDASEGWDQWRDSLDIDEGIMSAVNADDIFSVLVARLAATDQTILVAFVDSQDLIEIVGNVAVAKNGPTKVIFSPNAKVSAAIDITTASGQRFQGRVTSLHYWDAQSGANVVIATVKDCTGTLYPPNLLEYASAFDNINASIAYVYAHNGLEQNIVFPVGTILPESSAFGLNDATTRLQVWTTWGKAPTPKIRQKIVKRETVPGFPDLLDDTLDFGDFWLPTGVAFDSAGAKNPTPGQPLRVAIPNTADPNVLLIGKQWTTVAGLATLIESVDYNDLAAKLASMQQTASLKKPAAGFATSQAGASVSAPSSVAKRVAAEGSQSVLEAARKPTTFLVSSTPHEGTGFVLDYTSLSGSVTSYTFTNGATYYIQNSFSVSSSATFQSDCRIKLGTNAYLLFYGTGWSWPTMGAAPAYFSSSDDDSHGEMILTSAQVPFYSAQNAIWVYFPGVSLNVSNARVRWAQTGVRVDENIGVSISDTISNTRFENCNTALYLNASQDSFTLSQSTMCHTATAVAGSSDKVTGSLAQDCNSSNSNGSRVSGHEAETALAINPVNPSNVVAISVWSGIPGMYYAVTTDNGTTWNSTTIASGSGSDGLPGASGDPSAAFDSYGNFFLVYMGAGYNQQPGLPTNVVVAYTTNATSSPVFTVLRNYTNQYGVDSTRLTTGPGYQGNNQALWISWADYVDTTFNSHIAVIGAPVTGHGAIGSFTSQAQLPGSNNSNPNISHLAITGSGAVNAAFTGTGTGGQHLINVSMNPNSTQNPQWSTPTVAATPNLVYLGSIPALPHRGIWLMPFIATDRNPSSPNYGRVYLAYADYPNPSANTNVNIYFVRTDTSGTNWLTNVVTKVNGDSTTLSHFHPSIAVDQTSPNGNIAVAWHDCRNDPTNVKTQVYAAVARDGGASTTSFSANNFRLSPGTSDATRLTIWPAFDYGDYTGLAYYTGLMRFSWADNSNDPCCNVYTNGAGMNVYTSVVAY